MNFRERRLFGVFRDSAIRRGNEFYFDRDRAMRFLETCDREDLAVVGIECFRITSDATEPDMNFIADYSSRLQSVEWPEARRMINAEARQFVASASEGLFFNFVVSSSEEHRQQQ